MPRGLRKKTRQYDVLDQFQDEDPEAYFQYKDRSCNNGLTYDQTDLLQAIKGKSTQKVKSLLERGVDPNCYLVDTWETMLHQAVVKATGPESAAVKNIVGYLLFFGADPNTHDRHDRTPLHAACETGSAALVEMLIAAGADVNVVDSKFDTPLLKACSVIDQDSLHLVKMLLDGGAQIFHYNERGQTALHKLAGPDVIPIEVLKTGVREEIALLLLKHGLGVNLGDFGHRSPFHEWLSCDLTMHTPSSRGSGDAPDNVDQEASLGEIFIQGGSTLDREMLSESRAAGHSSRGTLLQGVWRAEILASLINKLHLLLPRSNLQDFLQEMNLLNPSDRQRVVSLFEPVEMSLGKVLSLAQLSRLQIRTALGGRVFADAQSLPLPRKMKQYLQCGD